MAIPKITEKQVKSWFDGGSFQRGKGYYLGGNIQHPRCQGPSLSAQCLGSSSAPYRVQVELNKDGSRATTDCSCPISGGCKHCVALLLQWVHKPDTFSHVEELAQTLADRSKEDLIKLIGQMLDKHPDLETMIDISVLSSASASIPVDPAVIQRQVMTVIEETDYDDYDYYGGVDLSGLDGFGDLINGYFASKEWFNAATVSMTIIDSLLDNYEHFHDEEGEVGDYVDAEVDHLEKALQNLEEPKQRTTVLRALFDVFAWDVEFGGIDMGYRATEIILDSVTSQEKAQVIRWTREKLTGVPSDRYSGEYRRRAYGGLLLQLEEDVLGDEAYIRICRESGRTDDLVERLLTLKRVDEALQAVRPIEDYSLLRLADQFVKHGAEAAIAPLIQQRAVNEGGRQSYSNWLKDRAVASGDSATAISILKGMFDSGPNLRAYSELRSIAQKVGEWGQLREQIIAQLQKAEDFSLLTQIHLDEKDIDSALRTVERIQGPTYGMGAMHTSAQSLKMQIANAAEESHPNASIRFYLEAAERLVAARGRGSYHDAAIHLQRVRSLYQKLGQQDEWLELIRHVREQNRTLRAMQDEFNRAGLEE